MNPIQSYVQGYFGIHSNDIDKVEQLFKREVLEKDSFYCTEEGPCNKLSFIHSGNIRIYKNRKGKEITQWLASEGEFVTDLSSLMFDTASRWNIQAITDCELFTIHKENYKKLDHIVENWKDLENKFLSKCFLTLEERVFSFISMNAEERFIHLSTYKKEIINEVPGQFIASMIGMTPETYSRIRKKKIT